MSDLILIAPTGYPKANVIKIAAQVSSVKLNSNEIAWKQTRKGDFQETSPFGTVPTLVTPNQSLGTTNSILKYIARIGKQSSLYGQSIFEQAKIDQYLDLNTTEISPFVAALTAPIFGWLDFNQQRYEVAKQDMAQSLVILNSELQMKTYLVGHQVTLADLAIYSSLVYLFKFILDDKARLDLPHLTRWFVNLSSQPIFIKYFGKHVLAKKEWSFEGQQQNVSQAKQAPQKQQQQKQKAAPKKQEKAKKEQPKKQEKKEQPKKEEAPKKQGNPLDHLPPTDFNLFDFKTAIVNSKNKNEQVDFLIKNLDRKGFSIYLMFYDKYEGEGEILYQTSNLKDNTLQRLDPLRKYAYGTFGVYGEDKNYDIFGVFLWRGPEIPQEVKDIPNYDYHKYTKLDLDKEEDLKLLREAWTGLEEDKSVVNGKIARDITLFK